MTVSPNKKRETDSASQSHTRRGRWSIPASGGIDLAGLSGELLYDRCFIFALALGFVLLVIVLIIDATGSLYAPPLVTRGADKPLTVLQMPFAVKPPTTTGSIRPQA